MNKTEIVNNMLEYKDSIVNKAGLLVLEKKDILYSFIMEIFNIDIKRRNFKDIREFFVDFFSFTRLTFPTVEDEFYNFIFTEILGFKDTPKNEYQKVSKTINQIIVLIDSIKNENTQNETLLRNELHTYLSRIRDIDEEIIKLKKCFQNYGHLLKEKKHKTHEVIPEVRAKIEEFEYYNTLLEDEKSRIQKINIERMAIKKARESDSDYKYNFSYIQENSDYYKAGYDYSITIKFVKELSDFIKLYKDTYNVDKDKAAKMLKEYKFSSTNLEKLKKENLEKYEQFLFQYITESKVDNYVMENIENNHVLKHRMEIIGSSISSFLKGDYLTFMNLIPIQIEGIFYDMCDELDIVPRDLSSYSLKTKISEIGKIVSYDEKPYFLYQFPLIRNKVAHGLFLENTNLRLMACETLLDLQYLVHVMNDEKYMPYVEPLKFVSTIKDRKNASYYERIFNTTYEVMNLYNWLNTSEDDSRLKWILNPTYETMFEFYGVKQDIVELRSIIQTRDFYDFVQEKLNYEKKGDAIFPRTSHKTIKRWNKIYTLLLKFVSVTNKEEKEKIINFLKEINS